VVLEAAKTLNLLDDKGALVPLDSLSVLDLVNELERVASVSVPTNEIRAEAFESVDTVAAMLKALKP
jgi:acyl carrier protein